MNAEDKQILIKIGVSVIGLVVAFKLFGVMGVIIGLVACYFLFKERESQERKEERNMSDAQFNFIWFIVSMIVSIILAALFGLIGLVIGLGIMGYALYNLFFNSSSSEYIDEDEELREKYIRQLEEENKRLKK